MNNIFVFYIFRIICYLAYIIAGICWMLLEYARTCIHLAVQYEYS